jgi:hypothetical protein
MPVNYLLIESLYEFHRYYGDEFRVEYPTGSGQKFSLSEIADELARRATTLFLKNKDGERPVMGAYPLLQADPKSADLVLFHEYFHGDNGRGVGASHQTGWSGLVALLLQPRAMAASGNVPLAGEPERAPIPMAAGSAVGAAAQTATPARVLKPEPAPAPEPEPEPAVAVPVTK